MRDPLAHTIQTYNEIATDYAKRVEKKLSPEIIEEFLAFLPEKAKVLDIGSGSGRDAQYFFDKGIDVVGIDLSYNLVKQAKKLHPDIEFLVMDMRDMKFEDDTFDGIWANGVIHHLEMSRVHTALLEILRVLKPGGLVTASVKKGDGSEMVYEELSCHKGRFFRYYSEESLERVFKAAGFKVVAVQPRNSFSRNLDWLFISAKAPLKGDVNEPII